MTCGNKKRILFVMQSLYDGERKNYWLICLIILIIVNMI